MEVLDHLVITETSYTSFEDRGIMNQLRKSGFYEVTGPEKKELEAFKLETERKRAEKEKAKDIAKKMKEDGIDLDTIKKYTGLSKKEIGGI